ncbi:hypothetical protein RHOFW510R12_03970 [Rhodanobacter sp. FW510-R12]|uniref:hypothetical protein n=1 Tax=Rhodanobacter thiooxydans TaxID=416169 RepID=UPI0004854D48|nr:hypothetical protein [Rhodanobacter thiooxydans]UJJ55215.1 hypothetical protein LRK53_02085 [Rhodanobacter thiooxydans]
MDQGAFELQPLQRAKPSNSEATTTSTQVSVSVFCGIMLFPFDGRLRADTPSRETELSLPHVGDMCLKFFSIDTDIAASPFSDTTAWVGGRFASGGPYKIEKNSVMAEFLYGL